MKYITAKYTSNIQVSPSVIGFGAMAISEFYGKTDLSLAKKTIRYAFEQGINMVDTADVYGFGRNEIFLNEALNLSNTSTREKIIVASKCGVVRDESSIKGVDVSPDYIKAQLDGSLQRLGTDYIDIYYLHRLPANTTQTALTDTMGALSRLKEAGKIRAIGVSEFPAKSLRVAHDICPISFLQTEYSIMRRGVETDGVLAACQELGIIFVAYSPLWRGGLTPGFDPEKLNVDEGDWRSSVAPYQEKNWSFNQRVVERLAAFAQQKSCTLPQLALAWLRHQGVITIPGMRKPERVDDNLQSLQVSLTQRDLATIDTIAPVAIARGIELRYPEEHMEMCGLDADMAA